jgi:hypothetical protein
MEYLNHTDYLKLSKAKQKAHDKQNALEMLSDVKPNEVIYTTVKHVSASGMSRDIAVCRVIDGRIQDISYFVSKILDRPLAKNNGVKVAGCGMDMGFHLVYSLSYALFPKGTDAPHGTRNGDPDSDGGYVLKHEWL